jgi:hypothetical protein
MRDILADLLEVAEETPVKQKLYDLWMVRVHPRTGEPTGQEALIGAGEWAPVTLEQGRMLRSKFTEYRWRKIEMREVSTQSKGE